MWSVTQIRASPRSNARSTTASGSLRQSKELRVWTCMSTRTHPADGSLPTPALRRISFHTVRAASRSSSSEPSLSITRSARPRFTEAGIWALTIARASSRERPRWRTRRSTRTSRGASTRTIMSKSSWSPTSNRRGMSCTTRSAPSCCSRASSLARSRATSGCTMDSSRSRASGSANTSCRMAARSSESPSITSSPNASRTRSSPSDPGSTAWRARTSASTTCAPASIQVRATDDLPPATFPVRPTRNTAATS